MSEPTQEPNAMACPFCGEEMTGGHIWVSGGSGPFGKLNWQSGSAVRTGLFTLEADEALLEPCESAERALRCPSCKALLTRFEDPD